MLSQNFASCWVGKKFFSAITNYTVSPWTLRERHFSWMSFISPVDSPTPIKEVYDNWEIDKRIYFSDISNSINKDSEPGRLAYFYSSFPQQTVFSTTLTKIEK